MKKQFELSESDKIFFAEMRGKYQSESEKKFFQKLSRKEQYESAFANELLVYEKDNPDGIYFIRKYYDTYLIGYEIRPGYSEKYECETLVEALSLRLDLILGFPRPITLMDWLRESDYEFVSYERNYDKD